MVANPTRPVLEDSFVWEPEETERIETKHRRIITALPAPDSTDELKEASRLFPKVNCYQPPVIWDRADGYQVFDASGNCWIDFSSTAVMTNTGHGHPAIRDAVAEHAANGLMAQFNFASSIRIELARKLLEIAPEGCEKVYFWTIGSESIEAAFRLARQWGMKQAEGKYHVLTHEADFHGWTLGAHQVSGESARKPWLVHPDSAIHHMPFPHATSDKPLDDQSWADFFDANIQRLEEQGITGAKTAAIFIETLQGWGALPLPTPYVQRLRQWSDENNVLVIFDEVQTGFGRSGRLFAHEHYGVRPDLLCIAKGVTSTLPLAAVLGPAEVLDVLDPAEITTTHAAHPLCCAAALANIEVIERENLVAEAERKGEIAAAELNKLRGRHPDRIAEVAGLGLVRGIHIRDPKTGEFDREFAARWTWEAVKRGVMLFQVNRPTIKVCPPLIIPDDALIEGITVLGEALEIAAAKSK